MITQELTIKNKQGIHARPAALIVQATNNFKSEILIECNGEKVNAKSILALGTLQLYRGAKIKISAQGTDEEAAIKAFMEVLEAINEQY
jgi:phosphotransferase system HPr (HPr) family protein